MPSERDTALIPFRRVSSSDRGLFERYLSDSDEQNCDLNFANVFCWQDIYRSRVAEIEGFLVICFDVNDVRCYMQPVGKGDKRLVVELLRQDAKTMGVPLRLYGLSAEWRTFLESEYPSEFAFDAPRKLCDYIYRTEDLALLQGRKYQPKRNHLNRFVMRYDWHAEPLSPKNIGDCWALNNRWLQGREASVEVQAEQQALHRAFDNFEALGLRGLVLYADGRPVAFSYGTPITQNIFCIHVEKYDADVEGAATMINRLMAQSLDGEFELINREDDLGLEGLRFAKMSYYPTILLEKISALHLTSEVYDMRKMWHEVFGDDVAEIDSFMVRHDDAVPFVHKESGEVVSMLFVVPLQMWNRRVAYIYAVATQPEYRGRGLATKLLGEALQYAEECGNFDVVALIPSSAKSKMLYERLGFEDCQIPMEFPASDYLGTGSPSHDRAMLRGVRKKKSYSPATLRFDE